MRELVFETSYSDSDEISDQLMMLGAVSVTVEDARAESGTETPIFGEPGSAPFVQAWPHTRIIALLDEQTDAREFWESFCEADPRFEDAPMEVREISDRDWVAETQRQFQPFEVAHRLWVGPRWLEPPTLSQGAIALRIDPGMAFGTGSHATTQLCLEMLLAAMDKIKSSHGKVEHVSGPNAVSSEAPSPAASSPNASSPSVLDMGCGSGILAIAAAKLGAVSVTAVDIDPIAVATARDNAQANQAAIVVLDADRRIADATGFDIVMANILAQPLKVMAPALTRHTRPGGALLLSGILARQADEILGVYQPLAGHLGTLSVLAERDGWVCIGTLGR